MTQRTQSRETLRSTDACSLDRRTRTPLRSTVAESWWESGESPGIFAGMRTLFATALAAHACLIKTPTPAAVHAFRCSLRRLRAVIRLIAELLPPGDARYLARELKWMTRQLGLVRDLDVLEARLRSETTYTPQSVDEDVLIALVATDRQQAAQRAVGAATSARALLLFAGLNTWLRRQAALMSNGAALADYLPQRLVAQDAAVLEKGRNIGRLDRAARHRLRARIKALRYALEMLPWLCPADSAYTAALAALHTALGDMNDDAVGRRLTRDLRSTYGLHGPSHHKGPSAHERRAALEGAWNRFREIDRDCIAVDSASGTVWSQRQ